MAAIKNMADVCFDVVDMLVDEVRKNSGWGSAYSWDRYISAIIRLAEVSEEENVYWELVEDEIELNEADSLLHFKDARDKARNAVLQMLLAPRGTVEPHPHILEGLLELVEMSPDFREVVRDVIKWRKPPMEFLKPLNDPYILALDALAQRVRDCEPPRLSVTRD